jgi:hypothetical protein
MWRPYYSAIYQLVVVTTSLLIQKSRGLAQRSFQSRRNGAKGPVLPPFPVTFDSTGRLFTGSTSVHLDKVAEPLRITYSNDPEVVANWISTVVQASPGEALGIDTEAKPSYIKLRPGEAPKGPDVLQLSTCQECLVLQLSTVQRREHKSDMQRALGPLLRDRSIIKVGVGIDDDALNLWRASGGQYDVRGRFDLGGVGCIRGQNRGLGNLTEAVLGVQMAKSKSITMSNWAALPPLGMKQVEYAAMDAWAGAAVHAELSRRRPDLFAQTEHRVTCPNGIPKKERALKEILDRRIRRRELVAELRELEEEYFVENGGFFMCVDEAVEKEIVKLRIAITSLQHDRFLYFDPKEVGL